VKTPKHLQKVIIVHKLQMECDLIPAHDIPRRNKEVSERGNPSYAYEKDTI